jgi:hypothetical protein
MLGGPIVQVHTLRRSKAASAPGVCIKS